MPKVHEIRVHQHYCRLDVTSLTINRLVQRFQDFCEGSPLAIISKVLSSAATNASARLRSSISAIPFEDVAAIVAYGRRVARDTNRPDSKRFTSRMR